MALRGDDTADRWGIPRQDVERYVLRMARWHGIPPFETAAYGMGVPGRAADWREYVYAPERGWNIAASPDTTAAIRQIDVLADKIESADLLAARGIQVVETLDIWRPAHSVDVAQRAAALCRVSGDLFVKPRRGHGGRDAMRIAWDRDARCLRVTDYCTQGRLSGRAAAQLLAFRVAKQELVVQPSLRTASALASASNAADVVTFRVVTRLAPEPAVFAAYLEVPRAARPPNRSYSLIPVDPLSGVPGVGAFGSEPGGTADDVALAIARAGTDLSHELDMALSAHRAIPAVFAVAWDLALTDSGTRLLEGNAGPGLWLAQVAAGQGILGLEPAERPVRSA